MTRPNLLVILIDDLRFDEFGAGGHPYMQTTHSGSSARIQGSRMDAVRQDQVHRGRHL